MRARRQRFFETTRAGEIAHAMLTQSVEHQQKNFGGGERIARRTMSVFDDDFKMLGERVQAMALDFGDDAARERDRAEMRIEHSPSRKNLSDFVIDEAHVEGRIMRDQR